MSKVFLSIIGTGIIIDLLSKILAKIYLQDSVNILGNLLYLQYTKNTGIAFSIALPSFLLKIMTIILIFAIFYYYLREEKKKKILLIDISFGLILAGAIGNGIERIFQGYVIDFIGVQYFSIFNLADSFITIGALLYLYYFFKNPS